MKNITQTLLVTALSIGLVSHANAGSDNRHWRDDHRSRQVQKHHHYHAPPRIEKRRRHDWVAPAAILTLGGLAIGAAIYNNQPATPIYNTAPPPPSGNWYYCRSSGQYYPYTNACPEGWQAVSPR